MLQGREFTSEEIIPFLGILFTILAILLAGYFSRDYRQFWSPLSIIAIIFGYYCCLGPYQAVESGDTFDRLINMRKYYPSALWGALISLLSYVAGFYLHGRSKPRLEAPFPTQTLFEYGKKTFLIGFILFTISTGGNVAKVINPLNAEYVEQVGGSFGNYLGLSLNFVIPGITLLFLYVVLTRQKLLWFIVPFAVAVGIFITLGFRYRLVLLLGSLAIVFYNARMKKPNLIVISVAIFLFIAFMGIINLSRQYGSGLNVKKLEGKNTEGYYKSGLRESLIFQTSGAIIDIVPQKHPHAGFQPIWSTIIFPIPSAIYKEKNSSEYLFSALDSIYGKKYSKGAAMMAYGEYYLAFGWIGIIVGGLLTGWFFRKLWNWYLVNSDNALVVTAYAVTVTYLYVILSRGYLPQVTNLFFFSVVPIYVVLRAARKKYGRFISLSHSA
jgi:oligosaccharide repeat unit polymerase